MPSDQFQQLRERLLQGGVAPRHVTKLLVELLDHFDDIVREELARGNGRLDAERIARERLGSDESLAASVLARSELRSLSARLPAVAYAFVPLIVYATALFASFAAIRGAALNSPPAWLLSWANTLCIGLFRVAPVAIGLTISAVAARQRAAVLWPMVGAALLCVMAGSVSVNLVGDELGVSSVFLTKGDAAAFVLGLVRAWSMLAVAWLPYAVWRKTARMRADD